MLQKIKTYVLALAALITFSAPALVPIAVYADTTTQQGICTGVNAATDTGNCGGNGGLQLGDIAQRIVNILSIIVGIVAVIMIIFGGFRYITSGGDSGNVSSAKNTLIYAIVGLIIVALAQVIVHFVIQGVSSGSQGL